MLFFFKQSRTLNLIFYNHKAFLISAFCEPVYKGRMQYRSMTLRKGKMKAWDRFVAVDVGFRILVVFIPHFGFIRPVVLVPDVGFMRPVILVSAICDITILPLMG